jgi:ABC-type uncharacterized transport system permease subunit
MDRLHFYNIGSSIYKVGDVQMQRLWAWLGILGAGMFCGLIMISVALGSIVPKVNSIAAPIVCGNQSLNISQYTASYSPGSVDTTTTFYCIDQATGDKRDVTGLIVFTAGMIYSLIIAAIIMVWGLFSRLRSGKSTEQAGKTTVEGA